MSDIVLSDQIGSTRILTLNRPHRLNAVSRALIDGLRIALIDANADDQTRVIILKGAGRAFCSGNDLKESATSGEQRWQKSEIETHARNLQEITRLIVNSDKIVIAAVHGWAVGAGMEWVLNCDFSIWAESAQGFFPEAKWNLSATGGVMAILPRIVGAIKAREMLLLGEKYTASELHDLGIAWRVVPDADLDSAVIESAGKIAELSRPLVNHFKRTFNKIVFNDLDSSLEAEVDLLIRSLLNDESEGRIQSI